MMSDDPTYTVESDFFRTARVDDIELSQSAKGLSRKVLRAELLDNPKDQDRSVRACVVHQKRNSPTDAWSDLPGPTLANTSAKEPSKFPLDSSETWTLFGHLANLYEIGVEGIRRGKVVLQLHNEDEIIRTDPARAQIIQKLLKNDHGGEVWDLLVELQPDLADRLALALRHRQRAAAVKKFEDGIDQDLPENKWKAFLKLNSWMFGGSNVAVIGESRLDIKNDTDIPFEVDGGFMDVVELKRPSFPFWTMTSGEKTTYLYRSKFPVPHYELQGAIAQIVGYILQAEKRVADSDFLATHGVRPLKPRGLVVHGRSNAWTEVEWTAFRLLNDSLHGVQVMTFDHLLTQARRVIDI